MKDILKNKGCLIGGCIGAVVVLIIIVVVVITLLSKSGNPLSNIIADPNYGLIKDEQGATYSCLMKPETELSNIGTQQFEFVVSNDELLDWGELRQDNGVRKFSISGLESGTSENNLYLITYMPDGTYITKNLTTTFQVCDKNNNTVQSSYLESKGVNPISSDSGEGQSLSSESKVPSFSLSKVPGVYRMDGLAFYNGQWILVSRMENLELY
jgi:hypothetical protein